MLLTDVVGKNHENSLWAKNPLANVVVMADECPGLHVGAGRAGGEGHDDDGADAKRR